MNILAKLRAAKNSPLRKQRNFLLNMNNYSLCCLYLLRIKSFQGFPKKLLNLTTAHSLVNIVFVITHSSVI